MKPFRITFRPTGDLVYYDEDGTLHYVSRIKDMIKCMDKQIAPAELEAILLNEFDAIQEVVVVGIPHPDYGEAPAAVVVVKGTQNVIGTVTEDRIKETICSEYTRVVCLLLSLSTMIDSHIVSPHVCVLSLVL